MGIFLGIILVVWIILGIAGNWLLFKKAGKPGWHSFIPILNTFDEYSICWEGWLGILFVLLSALGSRSLPTEDGAQVTSAFMAYVYYAAGIAALVLHFMQSMKLSKAFGKGIGMGLLLFFTDNCGRVILGLSSARYVGKPVD